MKSSFRFNGQETVVSDVIPASDRFNSTIMQVLTIVYGEDKKFDLRPVENFSNPEQTETIFNGVVSGQLESEAPIVVHILKEDLLMTSVAGFISFRK